MSLYQINNELISEESEIRRKKIERCVQSGIDPWCSAQSITHSCMDLVAEVQKQPAGEMKIAGRIMAIREHGKAIFATIADVAGRCQVYLQEKNLANFALFKDLIDAGDIVWFKGSPFTTKVGEPSLRVDDWKLLTKCLHGMPEKFHGITDIETKYRQRYLDLMSNQDVRERFVKRSRMIAGVRDFLQEHDFIEVETPMLHPIPGGAAAKPFVTHHNALDSNFYLRIAPELYLKRLLVGGFERVFEINRNFRNEGVSTRHNPEFTMVEFYMAHHDYIFIMTFVEELIRSVISHAVGTLQVPYQDYILDFSKPFERLDVHQILRNNGGYQEKELSIDGIDATLQSHHIHFANTDSYSRKLFRLFEETTEKKIVQPTFLIDFPIELSPLAKRDPKNAAIAARFELYIAGMEIANGFNELNDPFDQADRFHEQAKALASGDDEAMHYDADYITALEYGLPPTVGVGIGIDRLVMLATNTPSIKEVILFPTLKRK